MVFGSSPYRTSAKWVSFDLSDLLNIVISITILISISTILTKYNTNSRCQKLIHSESIHCHKIYEVPFETVV